MVRIGRLCYNNSQMRKFIFIILVVICGLFLLNFTDTVKDSAGTYRLPYSAKSKKEKNSEYIGEKITYEIKFGNFRIGEATFQHLDNTLLDGKPVALMTFETNAGGFYDLETIYSDLATFLPVKVTRKLRGLTFNEDITENYDQKNFMLTMVKYKNNKKIAEEKFDNQGKPIYNAVSLPFYLRRLPDLKVGWSFSTHFGSLEYKIILSGKNNLDTPLGAFETYHFESQPRKFKIWVTADERRIPVKIKDSGLLGYTLTMKGYSLEK